MAAVAFAAVALAYYGRDATAEYRFQSAIVQRIAQIPGRDLSDRQLIVEIDGGLRALSDRNRLEIAYVGAAICVRRSRDIFGFVRYSIWPKGFCLNN